MFDLDPAAREMARVVAGVRDDQLGDPTPCSDWTVADLLLHVHQFASVFTSNGRKEPAGPPQALVDDWHSAITGQLRELSEAWRDATAWHGRVSAGGVDMDAADNAVVAVAVEELTTHAWDLARATGQEMHVDDATLDEVERIFALFGDAPFGPAVEAAPGASRLDTTLARTGRDPDWSTPA